MPLNIVSLLNIWNRKLLLPFLLSHAPVDGDGREVLLHQELRQSHAAMHRLDKNHHLSTNEQKLGLNSDINFGVDS